MGTFGTWSDSPDRPGNLVLATYHGFQEVRNYPDSRPVRADCSHWAWVSRVGEPYLAHCRTFCEDCAEGLIEETDTHVAVKGALDTLRQHHGSGVADQVGEWMRKTGMTEDE